MSPLRCLDPSLGPTRRPQLRVARGSAALISALPRGPLLRALNRDGKKSHSFVNVCIAGGGGAEGDLIKARFRLIRLWQPLTRFLPGVSSVATRGGVTTEAPFPSLAFLGLL